MSGGFFLVIVLSNILVTDSWMSINRRSDSDKLCAGRLDLKSYLFLNKICEDCFNLYRDPDVYSACRLRITLSTI